MKEIIIHGGMNKAGSTVIQKYFLKNREKLCNLGVLYPKAGLVNAGHHALAWSIGAGAPLRTNPSISLDSCYASLKKEIEASPCKKVLISSEYLAYASADSLKYLQDFFREFGKAKVVFICRRQDKWVESLYAEAVKSLGYKKNINEFVKSRRKVFNYYEMLERWSLYFDEIFPVPYAGSDVQFELMPYLDIEATGFTNIPRGNVSLSPQGLAVMRLLPNKDAFSQSEHEKIINVVRGIEFEKRSSRLLSPKLVDEIKAFCEEPNRKMQEKYYEGFEFFNYGLSDDCVGNWSRPDVLKWKDLNKIVKEIYDKEDDINLPSFVIRDLLKKILSQ